MNSFFGVELEERGLLEYAVCFLRGLIEQSVVFGVELEQRGLLEHAVCFLRDLIE